MNCLVCNHINTILVPKHGACYARCTECGSITTSDVIASSLLTQNDNSAERNKLPNNKLRIERLIKALGKKPEKVMDYGCGTGELVTCMQASGIETIGIDYGNLWDLLQIQKESLDAITMIEVIEHLEHQKDTLEFLCEFLKPGGVAMIETTFADSIQDIATNPYVDPRIGHVSMLSHKALRQIIPWEINFLNPHVVIIRKP